MGPRKSAASNVTITVRSDSGEGHTPWWLEGIKLVPQLAWVVVGACLLVIFTGPLLRALEQGNITKLGIGVVQIDIAQKPFAFIEQYLAGLGNDDLAADAFKQRNFELFLQLADADEPPNRARRIRQLQR